MKTIQCTHPSHHHNGFVATCQLWTAGGGVQDGFFPDDISTIFIWFSLKSSTSTFSSLVMSPSFSILMQSFHTTLICQGGFSVFQKVLFDITTLLVVSLKNFFLAFPINQLYLFSAFL